MRKFTLIACITIALASCSNNSTKEKELATIDSLNQVIANQKIIDSMNALKKSSRVESNAGARYDAASSETPATAATPAKKKGWSSTAKGAVIGAGTGAVAGAIISNNKAKGAIIGGLIGAGVGAGTGAIIDKNKRKRADSTQNQ